MKSRDALFLFGAEYGYRVILAVLGLLTARFLEIDEFGNFISALALAQIVAIVVEAGMGQFVAKALARDPSFSQQHLGPTLSWRILTAVLGCLLAPAVAGAFLNSEKARLLSVWITPGVLLLTTVDFLAWILKGEKKSLQAAVVLLATRIVLFLSAMAALFSEQKLKFLVLSYALSGAFGIVLAGIFIRRIFPFFRPQRVSLLFLKETAPVIYKMGLFLIGTVAFARVDLILVHRALGEENAAYYGCATRIFDVLSFFPAAIHAVVMPYLSSLKDQPKLGHVFLRTLVAVSTLAVLLALAVKAMAPLLIQGIFGPAYAPSVDLLGPLLLSLIFSFPNSVFYALFFVWDRFREMGLAISWGLTTMMMINLVGLKIWGLSAAPWSRCLGEVLIFLYLAVCLWGRRKKLWGSHAS